MIQPCLIYPHAISLVAHKTERKLLVSRTFKGCYNADIPFLSIGHSVTVTTLTFLFYPCFWSVRLSGAAKTLTSLFLSMLRYTCSMERGGGERQHRKWPLVSLFSLF